MMGKAREFGDPQVQSSPHLLCSFLWAFGKESSMCQKGGEEAEEQVGLLKDAEQREVAPVLPRSVTPRRPHRAGTCPWGPC